MVGQAGIEQTYNNLLMGKDGAKEVIVNSLGREIEKREELPSTEGKRLQLTIDYDLQKAAQDGFTVTGFNGSAIMLDANSGEILTMVSRPAFDPNSFSGGIDRNTWAMLTTDKLRPLQNRAIQGRYSPGSTFKIAVAVAALEEGIATPAFRDVLSRRRHVLRPLLQVPPEGRPRLGRHAAGAGALLQRVLLHARQHARHRPDAQVGVGARPRRDERDRSPARDARPDAVDRVEEDHARAEVVSR